MPQLKPLLHDWTAQIVNAKAQSQGFVHLGVVFQQKRRRGRGVQEAHLRGDEFHLPSGQFGVDRLLTPPFHPTVHSHDVFCTQLSSLLVRNWRRVWFEHHLCQARAIPQIHKHHPPVVSPAVHPAAEDSFLSHMHRS